MRAAAALIVACALPLLAAKSDPFAGYVAGEPEECIYPTTGNGPQIAEDGLILYRPTGNKIWRATIEGCPVTLRQPSTLIINRFGSQICRNDRFRVLEPGNIIPSPYCRFGKFVPYTKVEEEEQR